MSKEIIKNLPLFLLFSAIALSPSFSAGTFGGGKIIELRIEDFLIVILGLIWIINILLSGRKKLERPPLFFPILAWLSIGFVSVLTNRLFRNLAFDRGFFYFLKQVELFVFYFYVFYHIRNIDSAKFFVKLWFFLGSLNVVYVIYQIIHGGRFSTAWGLRTGEYGTAAIGEWGVFSTGAFFLLIFIFLTNVFLYYFLNLNISKTKKGILGILAISPALGVFGSASKTDFLGFIFALFLTFLFLFLRKKSFKLILVGFLILIFSALIFVFAVEDIQTVHRLLPVLYPPYIIENFRTGRGVFIGPLFREVLQHPFLPFLGFGIGYVGEAHNQFLRNYIETGIIGSLVFLLLIWLIIKKSFRKYAKSQDGFSLGLAAGLLVATLTMLFFSLATEPFITVKPASVYWSFAAITMAVIYVNQRKHLRCNSKS